MARGRWRWVPSTTGGSASSRHPGLEDAPNETHRHRNLIESPSLDGVVLDKSLQRRESVALHFALDEVGASRPAGRAVGDPHDALNPLSIEDALAASEGVAGELDLLDAPNETRHHRDLVEPPRLTDVLLDQGLQRREPVALEATLDEVGTAPTGGRSVVDAHHTVNPLAVDDPLIAADGVAGQLHPLTNARRRAG